MTMINYIFDSNGEMLIIDNIEHYLTLQLDDDIVKTFETNLYWHKLNIMAEELVNEGYARRFGEPYKSELIENTIDKIKQFMIENYDFKNIQFIEIENKIKKLLPKK